MAEFAYKTTGTASNGAVLTEGGFIGMTEPTAEQQFAASIDGKLNERSLYDCPISGDRHYKARRVAERLGITVLDYYDFMIAEKLERATIAAEQGICHHDSLHDHVCYSAMKSAYIAGK